jgi:hypothetical protein
MGNEDNNKNQKQKKTKQFKVAITEKGMNALNQYLELVNKTSKRRIKGYDLLEYAVEKLSDRDIQKIQERVYTPDDKMEVMLEEYNRRNPDRALTEEGFKELMVEMFDKQILSKTLKNAKSASEITVT